MVPGFWALTLEKPMLHRHVAVALIPLTCAGLVACSGAEAQDVLSGAASSSGTSGTTPGSSGSTSSGGTSGTTSGGTAKVPGDCVQEQEPNDTRATANVLAPARCGTLNQQDQKDLLTFQLQPSSKTMSINFSGRIRLKVEIPGKDTVELTPDSAGLVPFVRGAKYMIEVTALTSSSTDVPWRVAIVEQ